MNNDPRQIRSSNKWRKLSLYMRKKHPVCFNPFNDHPVKPCDEVHHIIPIRRDPSKAFDKDNLVTLCRKCHDKVDSMIEAGYPTEYLFDEDNRDRGYEHPYADKHDDRCCLLFLNSYDEQGGGGCKKLDEGIWCEKLRKNQMNFCGTCSVNREKMKCMN